MIGHAAALIKGGHTHGRSLAMYMPVGLMLRGMADTSMIFAPVTMIGVVGFMVSAGFLLSGSRGLGEKSD